MTNPGGKVIKNFRKTFQLKSKDPLRWFPGHMEKGLKTMGQSLKHVDCIVEVHDARIPLSGHCANIHDTVLGIKPHILVLNKVDLTDNRYNEAVIQNLNKNGVEHVIFTNFLDMKCNGMKKLFPLAKTLIGNANRYNRNAYDDLSIMIVGVPNVGKSSLINRLRNRHLKKGNATAVGAIAGITRSVLNRIKVSENPTCYILDTPGILSPKVSDIDAGFKLAIAGCLPDHLVGSELIADYLLYWLNKQQHFDYVYELGLSEPNDDIKYVLSFIAAKFKQTLNIKLPEGSYRTVPNWKFAADHFLNTFRKGSFGFWCLDEDRLKL